MKTNNFFWGIFLTVLGILFLIDNLSILNIDADFLLNLWPLILIFVGLKLIIKNQILTNLILIITSTLLALIVYAFVFNPFSCGDVRIYRDMKKEKKETISHFYSPQIKDAKLNLSFSFGKMTINSNTDKLIDGEVRYKASEYNFDGEISDTSALFFLIQKEKGKSVATIFQSRKKTNFLNLHLNQNPIWEIKVNADISDFDLDLSSLKSKEIKIESNFSSGKINIGKPISESRIYLDLNFTNLKIDLPDDVDVEVITDKNFSNVDLIGLEQIEKNIYRSKNFDRTKDHFVIELSSNFSSVSFH